MQASFLVKSACDGNLAEFREAVKKYKNTIPYDLLYKVLCNIAGVWKYSVWQQRRNNYIKITRHLSLRTNTQQLEKIIQIPILKIYLEALYKWHFDKHIDISEVFCYQNMEIVSILLSVPMILFNFLRNIESIYQTWDGGNDLWISYVLEAINNLEIVITRRQEIKKILNQPIVLNRFLDYIEHDKCRKAEWLFDILGEIVADYYISLELYKYTGEVFNKKLQVVPQQLHVFLIYKNKVVNPKKYGRLYSNVLASGCFFETFYEKTHQAIDSQFNLVAISKKRGRAIKR